MSGRDGGLVDVLEIMLRGQLPMHAADVGRGLGVSTLLANRLLRKAATAGHVECLGCIRRGHNGGQRPLSWQLTDAGKAALLAREAQS